MLERWQRWVFPGGGGSDPRATRRRAAFTLLEILVVVVIISILAALLLPALSAARARSRQAGCANNLKQLALGFQMYAVDNESRLPENTPAGRGDNPWVRGDLKNPQEATNQIFIRQNKLFPYANHVAVYRCPADQGQAGGAANARSYSMNGWMGSRAMELDSRPAGFRTFVRESELAAAKPAELWVLLDEHEASIDDGWFLVTMDDSKPFDSFPATRHQKGYGLNFADAHLEFKKLRDPNSLSLGSPNPQINPKNSDWIQLKQWTTTR
jgi:prepilin-type N-terminal cleavage/methylation domain-containing protein